MSSEGWKETAPWKTKFRFTVKVIKALNLKMWILKTRTAQANFFWIFEILHFKMRKCKQNELTSPYEIYSPPLKSKIFWPNQKPKIPKFQLPPNLAGVAHYALVLSNEHVVSCEWVSPKINTIFPVQLIDSVVIAFIEPQNQCCFNVQYFQLCCTTTFTAVLQFTFPWFFSELFVLFQYFSPKFK